MHIKYINHATALAFYDNGMVASISLKADGEQKSHPLRIKAAGELMWKLPVPFDSSQCGVIPGHNRVAWVADGRLYSIASDGTLSQHNARVLTDDEVDQYAREADAAVLEAQKLRAQAEQEQSEQRRAALLSELEKLDNEIETGGGRIKSLMGRISAALGGRTDVDAIR